jgi:nitrogen fixation protein NifX
MRYQPERRLKIMKVAFATTDGISVDEHFGRAGLFAVYELNRDGYRLVEMRRFADGIDREVSETKGMGRVHDEAVGGKVEKLADCKIVYLTEIGGPSAARLVRKGMMPVKVKEPVSIEESLSKLLETVKSSPPPWLRKLINSEQQDI